MQRKSKKKLNKKPFLKKTTESFKKKRHKFLPNKKTIGCFFILLFLDQTIKRMILLGVEKKQIEIDYLFLNYVCNEGVIFGFHFNWILIIFINFLIIAFILWIIFSKIENNKLSFALFLIVGGAVSNLIDRLLNGCVVDYIDLKVWPIFNLADLVITGASIFIIKELFIKKENFSDNKKIKQSP